MIHSISLFPNSIDAEKLETLVSEHIDSMKGSQGLLAIQVSEGNLMSPGRPSNFAKVIETHWDSLESFMAWAQNQTPEANEAKDFLLENGAVLVFYEVADLNIG